VKLSRCIQTVQNSPLLARLRSTFPLSAMLVSKLFTRAGLRFSVGILIAAVCWFTFLGVVQDLLANDPLVRSDLRIVAFLQTLRSPAFSQVMLFFTDLANWQMIIAGAFLLGVSMYLCRQWWWLIALIAALAGEQLLSQLLKLAFHRPRPDLHNALIPAAGGSFPSGHALAGSVFYGFLACFIVSQTRNWLSRIVIVTVAGLLIAGIAFSRVYLGVHWPSDVLGSLALGPAWIATVLLVLSQGWIPIPGYRPEPTPLWHATTGFALWALAAGTFFIFSNPLVIPVVTKRTVVALAGSEFDSRVFDTLPRFTEDVTGAAIEPINVILIGDEGDLEHALAKAGWVKADPLNIKNGLKLVWAEIRDRPDPEAPGVPAFLNGVPNELTFERPTDLNSVRERHHLHVWSTGLMKDGRPVWAGTTHLDTSGTLYRGLTYHKIDPDLDRQRNLLLVALQTSSCVKEQHSLTVTAPMNGKNIFNNVFFTDGKALEIELQCRG